MKLKTGRVVSMPRTRHCEHPLAVAIDPNDNELRQIETMLANCPNCSQWTPGDGPIMMIVAEPQREWRLTRFD